MTARTVMKFPSVTFALVFFLVAAPLFAQQPAQTMPRLTTDKRVLIISIDGMRPDVLFARQKYRTSAN